MSTAARRFAALGCASILVWSGNAAAKIAELGEQLPPPVARVQPAASGPILTMSYAGLLDVHRTALNHVQHRMQAYVAAGRMDATSCRDEYRLNADMNKAEQMLNEHDRIILQRLKADRVLRNSQERLAARMVLANHIMVLSRFCQNYPQDTYKLP